MFFNRNTNPLLLAALNHPTLGKSSVQFRGCCPSQLSLSVPLFSRCWPLSSAAAPSAGQRRCCWSCEPLRTSWTFQLCGDEGERKRKRPDDTTVKTLFTSESCSSCFRSCTTFQVRTKKKKNLPILTVPGRHCRSLQEADGLEVGEMEGKKLLCREE